MYTSKLLNLVVVQYEVEGGVNDDIGLRETFFDFSLGSKASFSWQVAYSIGLLVERPAESKFWRSLDVLALWTRPSDI